MNEEGHGWIRLANLQVDGARLGVYPTEHNQPRAVIVDVALWVPTAPAANTDQLTDTIDYDAIAAVVRDVCTSRHFNLLESLSEALATALLERFAVERITLEVQKPGVSAGATATISIERHRRNR